MTAGGTGRFDALRPPAVSRLGRTMRGLLGTGALAALLAAGTAAGLASAQDGRPEATAATAEADAVEVAGVEFELAADVPLEACVVGIEESLAGRVSVVVQLVVRQLDGPRALTTYDAPPVGVFSRVVVGDCLALAEPRS